MGDKISGPVFTEVRVRQFWKTDAMEVMPTTTFFMQDAVQEVDVEALCRHITDSITKQVPGIRPSTAAEVKAFLRSEHTVATAHATGARTSLTALEGPKEGSSLCNSTTTPATEPTSSASPDKRRP